MSSRPKNRFKDTSKFKDVVRERGIAKLDKDTQRIINSRQWTKLAKHPEKEIMQVVRAFHANMIHQDNCNVWGVWIPFHRNRINEMLECPQEDTAEYLELLRNPPAELIRIELTRGRGQWVKKRQEVIQDT